MISLALVLAIALGVYSYFRKGKVDVLNLDPAVLEKTESIRFEWTGNRILEMNKDEISGVWSGRYGEEDFEPDFSVIVDFLHVFNLWEIGYIPNDSLLEAWKECYSDSISRLVLAGKDGKIMDLYFYDNGTDFVVRKGSSIYPMVSVWNPTVWKNYFDPEQWDIWRNRLMINLDYVDVAEVAFIPEKENNDRYAYRIALGSDGNYTFSSERTGEVSLDREKVESYLAAFRQVYFDLHGAEENIGKALYRLEVVPVQGETRRMKVHEKIRSGGKPDIFKAVVVIDRGMKYDTVELPYVVLDKMVKDPEWFIAR